MGKSRKHRHVDRNAYRAPGSTSRGQVAERRAPKTGAPSAVLSAFPLPIVDEPLVSFCKSTTAADFRSRYPAKKTRHLKRAALVAHAGPPARVDAAPELACPSDRPILRLTYQPPAPKHLWFADEPLPMCDALDLLEPMLWADDPISPVRRAQPVITVPTRAQEQASAVPLPRNAAITAWKKSGPLDIIGRWLRTRARSLALQIAPRKSRRSAELARLRAENDYLRQQLRALDRLQA